MLPIPMRPRAELMPVGNGRIVDLRRYHPSKGGQPVPADRGAALGGGDEGVRRGLTGPSVVEGDDRQRQETSDHEVRPGEG